MPAEVIMPALGMSQDTGTVVSWLKKEGEEVVKGEPLMEVETDKAVVEVEAPASGRLAMVAAAVGQPVPVGQVIAHILAPGETLPATAPAPNVEAPPAPKAAAPASSPEVGASLARAAAAGADLQVSPKARRLASELGVDLQQVRGTGPGGTVVTEDVQAAAATRVAMGAKDAVTAAPATPGLWRTMADRTQQSWQSAPHFYLLREIDASALVAWRAEQREEVERVTFTDLLVSVVAAVLRDHPQVNSRWNNGLSPEPDINVALAIAVEHGLVAPVIHHADTLSIADIARRRIELVEHARANRLSPAELAGGTFTISNLGMYGVDAFSAILNAGQAAILAVGRIADRVVAVGGRPEVRPAMTMTLSCDHRVIDGARGAEFLQALAERLERAAARSD